MSYQERLMIYERIKSKIASQNLKPSEYEKRVKALAKKLNV